VYMSGTPCVHEWDTLCTWVGRPVYMSGTPRVHEWDTLCTRVGHPVYMSGTPCVHEWDTLCTSVAPLTTSIPALYHQLMIAMLWVYTCCVCTTLLHQTSLCSPLLLAAAILQSEHSINSLLYLSWCLDKGTIVDCFSTLHRFNYLN